MKTELKTDLDSYLKQKSTPLFHKIKFDETSIYLTRSYYYEGGLPNTGKNDFGSYRIFSWADLRAKTFLGFELGQASPALGRANVIGSFTPNEDDIKDVKYITDNGKSYFKSAKVILSGEIIVEDNEDNEDVKIDSEKFMKMAEIIPTGAQGKAIYGEGNYIIDGPAGTGKSTTVLQKIKLLQIHSNVKSSEICIVVKNNQVVKGFDELLKELNIDGIKICTTESFLRYFYGSNLKVTEELLNRSSRVANELVSNYERFTNIKLLTSFSFNQDDEYNDLKHLVVGSDRFKLKLANFFSLAGELRSEKIDNNKKISSERSKLRKKYEKLESDLKEKRLSKIRKSGLRKDSDELSLSEVADIKDVVDESAKKENKRIESESEKLSSKMDRKYKDLSLLKAEVTKDLISLDSLAFYAGNDDIVEVLSLYCNKHYPSRNSLHTVIIDEAQDVSAIDIELIRLQTNSSVLAGDEFQTENENGIGSWNKLISKEYYEIDGILNLYQLRHNFRQTYELGSASYSYRQLLLGRDICDIKPDYFDNQIGFNKPQLVFVSKDGDFKSLVKDKIQQIKDTFTNEFPLVIFYENDKSLNRLASLVDSDGYTVNIDDYKDHAAQILFVSIDEIAGREFPVVIAPLTNNTSKNTIYVMLSRAKFDLTLITGSNRKIDPYISTLCEQEIIECSSKVS